MKITWSALAVEQAREIASYIALDKPSAAENWIDGIFESVDRLVEFPQSGRMVPEIKRNEIREIVQGSYRVIYKVQETQILILLVKAYRQKLKENEI
ncbi:MAG: type II toxin-antitoxin system RelE/ParE family toxin [Pseudomonadales bacterium]|nr:type II toxin-antitoxin system RelE/ParE family toxin [Pseudomonadales bacterium]